MNRIHTAVSGLTAVALSLSMTARADNHEEAAAVPVELYVCTYREGKGPEDLAKANKEFVKWAKKNEMGYTSWTITPQFRTSDEPFDVGWIGSWTDGKTFGAGMDAWTTDPGDAGKAFDETVDCNGAHMLAASVPVRAPDGPPRDGLVWFSSCTLQEGKNSMEAYEAHKKFSAAMAEMGAPGSSWLFYPGLGAGDTDFHYFSVVAFNNYAELGAGWEIYNNGDGWKKAMEILWPVTSCDSPRLYDAKLVFEGNGR